MGLTMTPAQDMQTRIRQGLLNRGLAPHIADAFVMNFQDESGLNPGINEAAPLVPGSRGGFGLYQLTGPRRVAYEQFAQQRGVQPSDVDAQLDFMMTELQGPESRAAKSIFAAQNTGDAAAAIVNDFLRPSEEHRARRAARYAGNGSQAAPQRPKGILSTLGPKQETPAMERSKPGGLLGMLFPEMDADRADGIRLGLNGMLHNPNQGRAQAIHARMGERANNRKTAQAQQMQQGQANKTAEWLINNSGSPELAAGVKSGALTAAQGLSLYKTQAAASGDPEVHSSKLLPDMSGTVMTMRDGSTRVITAGGEPLSGQAAIDFIGQAQDAYTGRQKDIYAARREGTLETNIDLGGEAKRVEVEGGMAPVTAKEFGQQAALIQSSITNMTDAIGAIDRGANSGAVYKMLPALSEASASLRNSMNRLGLDVIGSVTFGALSAAEMRLAMETAVPQNLNPADLRDWLTRKMEAQRKAYTAANEAAQFFASGGTQQEYYRIIGAEGNTASAQPVAGGTRPMVQDIQSMSDEELDAFIESQSR